jgi:hypothetical protein
MATFVFPTADQIVAVTAEQVPYKTGLVKLLKSAIALTPELAEADCVAAEADFSGYSAIAFTTLPAPYIDAVHGGVSFTTLNANFATGDPTTIGNDIYGGWIEDAMGALLVAFEFENPVSMNVPSQEINLQITINRFGDGSFIVTINGVPS